MIWWCASRVQTVNLSNEKTSGRSREQLNAEFLQHLKVQNRVSLLCPKAMSSQACLENYFWLVVNTSTRTTHDHPQVDVTMRTRKRKRSEDDEGLLQFPHFGFLNVLFCFWKHETLYNAMQPYSTLFICVMCGVECPSLIFLSSRLKEIDRAWAS